MRKYLTQIAAALSLVVSVVACSGEMASGHKLGATYGNPVLSSVTVSSPVTGNGTAASPISVPAATTSVAGLMSAADKTTVNVITPGISALAIAAVTPTIDFLSPSANPYCFGMPTIAGKHFTFIQARIVVTARTGTLAGSGTFSVGTDASAVNMQAALTFSLLSSFNQTTTVGLPFSFTLLSSNIQDGDVGIGPVCIKFTSAFTGATVMQGFMDLFGFYY